MTNAVAITELQDQLSELNAKRQLLLQEPGITARIIAIERAILYVEQEIERYSKLDPEAKRQA